MANNNWYQSTGYDFGNQVSIDELFEIIDEHINRTDNPHRINNKDIIGIENIDNTSDKNKPLSDPTKKYVDSEFTANLDLSQDSEGNTIIKLISKDGKVINTLKHSFVATTDIKGNEFVDSYVATVRIVRNADDHEQYLQAYSPSGKKLLDQKIPEHKIKDISIMEKENNIYLAIRYSDDLGVKGSLMPLIDVLIDRIKYTANSESKVVLGNIKCGELIKNTSIKDLLDRLFTLNNYVTTGKYIKGSYFIVKDIAERSQITYAEDSIVVNGSLVYVVEDDKEYIWKDDEWVPTDSVMKEEVQELLTKIEAIDIDKVSRIEIENIQRNLNKTVDKLIEKINSLEAIINSAITEEMADMQFKVDTLNINFTKVKNNLNNKVDELKTEVLEFKTDLEAKIDRLEDVVPYQIKQIDSLNPYLFEVSYENIGKLNFNAPYYKEFDSDYKPALCSSVRKGNYHGRNLDWYYHEDADFVLRVPAQYNLNGYVGMSYKSGLTASKIQNSMYNGNNEIFDDIMVLPFLTVDGINDKGLVINTNVVNRLDNPSPVPTTPDNSGKIQLDARQICNYVLTHYNTAEEAYKGFVNDFAIHNSEKVAQYGYEQHWMISDLNDTYIVELYNNEIRAVAYKKLDLDEYGFGKAKLYINGLFTNQEEFISKPDIYNFFRTVIVENDYGRIDRLLNTTLPKLSSGIERNNATERWYKRHTLDTEDLENKLLEFMSQDLKYTNTYTKKITSRSDFWYTEFVDYVGDCHADDTEFILNAQIKDVLDKYKTSFDRNHNFWQTVHTILYDLKTKDIKIISQENQYKDGVHRIIYDDNTLIELLKKDLNR